MPKNLSTQIVCPSLTVWDFDEKRLNWASVVRGANNVCQEQNINQYFVDNLGKDS